MATHFSTLAWRIPWTEELGELQLGERREGCKELDVPEYSGPGKSHGWRSLVGCSPWGHGVAQSQTQLSDFTFTSHFHALEKEMATHSSVRAWRTPGTGEPGGLPSMGSHRVGHD